MSILGLIAELRISALRHLDGEYRFRARYRYYKRRLKHLGRGVLIDTGVFIYGPEYVSLATGRTSTRTACSSARGPTSISRIERSGASTSTATR